MWESADLSVKQSFLGAIKILVEENCLLVTLLGRWWLSDPSGPFCALVRET